MADLAHYDLNEAWIVEANFTINGTPTDPTGVTATAKKPDGTTETYAFPGPNISNPAVGTYRVTDTGDQLGTWYIEVIGTGAAAGRARHAIVIDPRWPSDLLNPDALTTIETVEMLLDRAGSQGSRGDEEDDKRLIAFFINSFSDAVHMHTGRQFQPTEDDATRSYSYDGAGVLSLAPYEARAVTAVSLYTDRAPGEWRTLSASNEYRLSPPQKTPEGTYVALSLPRVYADRYAGLPYGAIQVTVTGDWGAGVVPSDVEYVVAGEAANAYMRASQRAPRGVAAEDFLGPDVGPLPLSRRSEAILIPHTSGPLVA